MSMYFNFIQILNFALTMVTSVVAQGNASYQDIFVTNIITVEMGLMKLIAVSSFMCMYVCVYVYEVIQ